MVIWQILFWRALALGALLLALAGVVLPGLPTTPFLLVAAWGGSRGWPGLERRLLAHPSAGPAIRRWRQRRAVPRGAKWLATVMMALSAVSLLFSGAAPWLVAGVALVMLIAGTWLWSRPHE